MEETKKQPLEFNYAKNSLEYFVTVDVKLNFNDYDYFELQLRYGPSWWLLGYKNGKQTELGRISLDDLRKFINWARDDYGGNRVCKINTYSSAFDIFAEINKLFEKDKKKEDTK